MTALSALGRFWPTSRKPPRATPCTSRWLKKQHRTVAIPAAGARGLLYYGERSAVHPGDAPLRTRLLHECHDAPTGGHLGKDKTIEQVKRRFYWPGMDAESCSTSARCDACQRNKPVAAGHRWACCSRCPSRTHPWQQVTMDLITQLPQSRSGQRRHRRVRRQVDQDGALRRHDAPTVTAPQLAELFWRRSFGTHGLPESILSDRDPRFTAHFWRALWKCLGTSSR